MLTIYSAQHATHAPPYQFVEGRLIPYLDTAQRVQSILEAVRASRLGPINTPDDVAMEALLAVHSPQLLEHLRSIYADWCSAGGPPGAVLPAVFEVAGARLRSSATVARAGRYSFDMSAPITEGTYPAVLAAAACALTGAKRLQQGEPHVYALCRPPGHHASADRMGGFCYLNNAAIAANHLAQHGAARVALLDVDVHHGNGSQAIFYRRSDVLFVSIHDSPEQSYPYFSGYADETGEGPGAGFNVNLPLPPGIDDRAYLGVLAEALNHITRYAPDYLVISVGYDAFADDPFGLAQLTTTAFRAIGELIGALGLPTLAVQEGGYAGDALGDCAVGFLRGLESTGER